MRLLLARRNRWSGEPSPSSSETVIVRSLPYYPGSREPLARGAREPLPSPQVHSFRLERAREEEAFLRQSRTEQPRFSSLLLEPVPAVPSPSLPSPLLRAVPAVPELPTLSTFTTRLPPLSSTGPPRTRPQSPALLRHPSGRAKDLSPYQRCRTER